MSRQNVRLQIKQDTNDNWRNYSLEHPDGPFLAKGELAYDTDQKKLRVGDGVTPWEDLPVLNSGTASSSEILEIIKITPNNTLEYSINLTTIATAGVKLFLMKSANNSVWTQVEEIPNLPTEILIYTTFTTTYAIRSGYYYRLQLSSTTNSDIAHSGSNNYRPISFTNIGSGKSITVSSSSNKIEAAFSIASTYLNDLYLHFYSSTSSSDYTISDYIKSVKVPSNTETSLFITEPASRFIHGKYFYAEFRTSDDETDDTKVVMTMNDSGRTPTVYSVPDVIVSSITGAKSLTVTINKDPTITYTGPFTLYLLNESILNESTNVAITSGGTDISITSSLTQTVDIITTNTLTAGTYSASVTDADGNTIIGSPTGRLIYQPITFNDPLIPITFIDSNDYSITIVSNNYLTAPLTDVVIYETDNLDDTIDSTTAVFHSANIPAMTEIITTLDLKLTDCTYFTNNKYYTVALCYRDTSGSSPLYYERIITSSQIQLTDLSVPTTPTLSLSGKFATVDFDVGSDASKIPYSNDPTIVLNGVTDNDLASTTYELKSDGSTITSGSGSFTTGNIYRATIEYTYPFKSGTYSATISGGVPKTSANTVYKPFSILMIVSTSITTTAVTVNVVGTLDLSSVTLRLFRQRKVSGTLTTTQVGTDNSVVSGSNTFTGLSNIIDDDFYVDVIATGSSPVIVLQTSGTATFNVQNVSLTDQTIVNNNQATVSYNITNATAFDASNITLQIYDQNDTNTSLGTSAPFLKSANNGVGNNIAIPISASNTLVFGKTYVIYIIQNTQKFGSIKFSTAYSPITLGTPVPYDKRYMKVPLTVSTTKNFSNATLGVYRSDGTLVGSIAINQSTESNDTLAIDLGTDYMTTSVAATYTAKIVVVSTVVLTSDTSASISSSSFIKPTVSVTYGTTSFTTKTTEITAYDTIKVYYTYVHPGGTSIAYPKTAKPTFKIWYATAVGQTYSAIATTTPSTFSVNVANGSQGPTNYSSITDPITGLITNFIPPVPSASTTWRFVTTLKRTLAAFIQGVYYFQILDYDGTENAISNGSGSIYSFAPLRISGFTYGNYYENFNLTATAGTPSAIYTTANTYCAVIDSTATPDEIISNYTKLTVTGTPKTYPLLDTDGTTPIEFTNDKSYYVMLYYRVGATSTYHPISLPSSTLPFRKAVMKITNFAVSSFTNNRKTITYTVKFTNSNNTATVMWYPSFVPFIGISTYNTGAAISYTLADATFSTITTPAVTISKARNDFISPGTGFTPNLNTTYNVRITLTASISTANRYSIHAIGVWPGQSAIGSAPKFPDVEMTPIDYYPTTITDFTGAPEVQGLSTVYSPYLSFTYSIVGNSATSLTYKLRNTTTSTDMLSKTVNISPTAATSHTVNVYHPDSSVAEDTIYPTLAIKVPTGSAGLVDNRYIIANDYRLEITYQDFNTKPLATQKFLPPGYDIIVLAGQSNMYGCDGMLGSSGLTQNIDKSGSVSPSYNGITGTGTEGAKLSGIYIYSLNDNALNPDNNEDYPYGGSSYFVPTKNTLFTNKSHSSISYIYSPKGYGQNTTWDKPSVATPLTVSMGQEFVKHYKNYILQTNRTIIVIPGQKGNTGFIVRTGASGSDWRPASGSIAQGSARANVKTALTSSMSTKYPPTTGINGYNRVAAMLWHQGEFDSQWGVGTASTNADTWDDNVEGLINEIKTTLNKYPTFKFILGEMLYSWALGGNSKTSGSALQSNQITHYSAAINNTIIKFDDARDYAKSVSSHGLHGLQYNARNGDIAIHLSNRAQRLMGVRYFQAFLSLDPYLKSSSLPAEITTFNIQTLQTPSSVSYALADLSDPSSGQLSWDSCSLSWSNTANASFYIVELINAAGSVARTCGITPYFSDQVTPYSSTITWDPQKIPFSWESGVVGCWVPGIVDSSGVPYTYSINASSPSTLNMNPLNTLFYSVPGDDKSVITKSFTTVKVYRATTQFNAWSGEIGSSAENSIFRTKNKIRWDYAGAVINTFGATSAKIYSICFDPTRNAFISSAPFTKSLVLP